MAHFYPLWIEHSGVTHGPLLPPKESKINGIMMSLGKNRLNMVEQFCDSDGMKIDRIHCLNDSESCWTGSFIGKVCNKTKMGSNNVINTELIGSSLTT